MVTMVRSETGEAWLPNPLRDVPELVAQMRAADLLVELAKTGMRDRVQVVIHAYESGLVTPGA